MIEIYLKTNTNYNKNGDITLTPNSCTYKDSEKVLTLEHFIDEEGRWKYIDIENVIAAEENGKKKLFRIYNVIRSLYSVTAYARPIFYDLMDTVLLDVRPTNKSAQEALDIILKDTGFKGHSNLYRLNTAYYIRKNIVEALLGDEENSFLNRWGGEFYCENFDIYINDKIGSDNGVRVEFGYNLNEINENVNTEDVVTRIIPIGFDGIMLSGDSPWVDSPLIKKYTHIKTRSISFSDVKVKENPNEEEGFNTLEEARAELINRCNKLYEADLDKPALNYKIDMINLANTTAYKNLKILTSVNIGDTVTCYINHLDIDVQARVIDYEKNLLTGEYISIELGNSTDNYLKNQSDIQNKVENIFNSNGNVKAETLEGAINALQTKFKALRDVAQPQSVRAILFEDRIEDSPTFGCMCLGTMGFEIASSFKPGTTEWDFRTFGTGKGFVADHIITGVLNAALIKAGILQSENGKTWINMESGTFNFANKVKFDGTTFSVDLSSEDLSTNESMKSIIRILNESISSKVSNNDFSSYKEQTAKEISSKVTSGDVSTLVNQSATSIKNEVSKTLEENYTTKSEVTQTANDIKYEFKQYASFPNLMQNGCPSPKNYLETGWTSQNAVIFQGYDNLGFYVYDGLKGEAIVYSPYVTVTSETTYSLVFSMMNEYNMSSYDVYIEETSYNGETTYKGLVWHEKSTATWKTYYFNHTTLSSTVKIRLRFDNNGMQDGSVGTQDLLQIKNVMCILGSNLKPIQWYPHTNEIMSNISTINGEGIRVKHDKINAYSHMSAESFKINKNNKDLFKVDDDGLKLLDSDIQVSHSDGSYTKMSYDGFKRYESGTSSTYHYYIKRGTVLLYSGESVNIEAPAHILQKEGVVLSVEQIVSPNTNSHIYSLNTMLVNSFFFDDYVKIQARLKWNNSSTQSVEEGGFIYVHYLIIG